MSTKSAAPSHIDKAYIQLVLYNPFFATLLLNLRKVQVGPNDTVRGQPMTMAKIGRAHV